MKKFNESDSSNSGQSYESFVNKAVVDKAVENKIVKDIKGGDKTIGGVGDKSGAKLTRHSDGAAKEPKLAIVILYYNAEKYVDVLFPSIEAQSYGNYDVIVVDNNSSDNGIEKIMEKYKWVKVIRNGENLGFSEGNNVGIREALKNNYKTDKSDCVVYDCVVLVNDDVYLPDDVFGKIAKHVSDGGNAIVGGPYIYLHLKGKVNPKDVAFDEVVKAHMVSGSLMAIPVSVIQKVGLLDKDYFLYFEDADYCYRAIQNGFDVLYDGNLVYYHASGGTTKIRNKDNFNIFKRVNVGVKYYYYRNEMMFSLLNQSWWNVFLCFARVKLRVFYHLLKGNKVPLVAFFKGLGFLFGHWKEIMRKRKSRKRTVPDSVINKWKRNKNWYARMVMRKMSEFLD